MSTWIELHADIFWHKKTLGAAKQMKMDVHTTVGYLAHLWTWALDHAPDGNLSHLSDRDIALAAGWLSKPSGFVDALRSVHFIDGDGRLHNWDEYAGRLIDSRRRDRERKRAERVKRGAVEAAMSAGQDADAPPDVERDRTKPHRTDRTAPDRGTDIEGE